MVEYLVPRIFNKKYVSNLFLVSYFLLVSISLVIVSFDPEDQVHLLMMY